MKGRNTMKNANTTFDTTVLCSRILKGYESLEDFADRTNVKIDRLTGKDEFVLDDISSIRKELNLTDDEVMKFFFPDMKPEEKQYSMVNALSVEKTLRRLEYIEDGLIALDMMTSGKIKDIGDTICNEDFESGFNFIMSQILDKVTDLRADLTRDYLLERQKLKE